MPINTEGLDWGQFDKADPGLEASMRQASTVSPAQYGQTLRMAEQSGLPVSAVESDPAAVESFLRLDGINWDDMSRRAPGTAQFLTDFNNAAVGYQDVSLLERMESLISGTARSFEGLGQSIALGFEQQLMGTLLSGADSIGSGTPSADRYLPLLRENADKDFVRRILSPESSPTPVNGNRTHMMAAEVNEQGEWFVFPTVVNQSGQLRELPLDAAFAYAMESGEFIPFGKDKVTALDFSENYKTTRFRRHYDPNYSAVELDNLIPASALPPGIDPRVAQQMSRQFAGNLGIESDEDLRGAKDQAVNDMIAEIQAIQQQREDLTPGDLNLLQQGVRAGIESLATQIPALTASMLTRSPAPMLGIMGLQTRGSAYAEARAEGLSPDAAGAYANIDAGIEVATEMLPASSLVRMLGIDEAADALVDTVGGRVKNRLLKEVGRFAVQEMGTEQIATLGQSLNAWGFELDEQLEAATSASEVADIMLERAAVTAIATAVAGGGQIGVTLGTGAAIEAVNKAVNGEVAAGVQEQQTIDEIARLAEQSEMKKASPESFNRFLAQNAAPGRDTVFIDGAQAALYLREQGPAAQEDPALILLAERVQEAAALGTDVAVSTADFATVIAGTPHFEALRDHMTMSTESVAPFRQEQVKQEAQAFVRGLMEDAQQNVSEYVEAQDIYEKVKDQLVDSGAYGAREAGIMAQIVPAWFTRFARQQGITVQEAYERSGLRIEGPQTGEKARLEGELAVLEQAKKQGYEGDILREAQEFAAGVRKFGPQGMTREARLERAKAMGFDTETVLYHGSPVQGIREFRGGTTAYGIFFSDSEQSAAYYNPQADLRNVQPGDVYRVFLRSQNRADLRDAETLQSVLAEAGREDEFDEILERIENGDLYAYDGSGRVQDEIMRTAESMGYDAVILPDMTSGELANSYIVFNPSQIRSINATFDPDYADSGDLLAQRSDTTARGYFDPNNSLIRLTEASDLSTFLHEFAHFMYEMELRAGTPMLQGIHDWFKRNAADVAAEANGYLAQEQGAVLAQDSDAFRRWFGDSKVVDAQGKPLVVYHGAPDVRFMDEDGVFKTLHERYNPGSEDPERRAFWFSNSRAMASTYADDRRAFDYQNAEPGIIDAYIKLENPLIIDAQGKEWREAQKRGKTSDVIKQAREEGRDGVIIRNVRDNYQDNSRARPADTYVVFDSRQIKSASRNAGTFDPQDPSILRQGDDYRGQHRAPGPNDGAPGYDVTGDIYPEDFYGPNGLRYYGDGSRGEAEAYSIISSMKGRPNKPVKIYRAVPHEQTRAERLAELEKQLAKYMARRLLPPGVEDEVAWYDEASAERDRLREMPDEEPRKKLTINPGDWVTITRSYAVDHGRSALGGKYKVISKTVKAKEIFTNGDSMQEWGYWPEGSEQFEQNDTPTQGTGPITEADVLAFLDQTTTSDKAKDAALRRAVHEQFARGFEKYLMEGSAPSVELRNAFRAFARWLVEVYRRVRGNLRVNLDDQMRQVFDRLIATEEQIAAAEARGRIKPLFTDAAMAGMTEEQFAAYQQQQDKARDAATESLRNKLIAEITRQTKAWWREELVDKTDEEMVRLQAEPVYRAMAALRGDSMKLDHAMVKATYGEDVTDKRGRKSRRIPPALNGMTVTGAQGVTPDDAAAFFGFGSGDEMVKAILAAPPLRAAAEEAAQARMVAEHGDILNDGSIEQQADEALQNEERARLLLTELKHLAKGTAVPTLDRESIKHMAEENIARLPYARIFPGKYRRAEIRAAQEAAVALAAGDKEGAARAKLRQVMNFYLGKAAADARAEALRITERMARYSRKSIRAEIQKAENSYMDQIDRILARFEFRRSKSMASVNSLNLWAKERMENDGDALVLSPEVLDETFQTHWKNVPFHQLKGIADSVANIEHVARYANKITRMGEEVDFKTLVQRWTEHMRQASPTRFTQAASVADRPNVMKRRLSWAMGQMTKIPWMASWLDGGARAGMTHQILVQPFTDALQAKYRLWKQVGVPVLQALNGRSKADIERHNRKVYIPEIAGTAGHTGNLMGHEILVIALNTGNDSNLRKMLLGEGWAREDVETEISFDNPKLQAVLRHMTASDWQLVQTIWDQIDQLYAPLAEVHRRTTGLTPPKVQAAKRTVQVDGETLELRGGYYPVKYDPARSQRAEENQARQDAQVESLFSGGGSLQATVNAGATNERTGYFAPISLNLGNVVSHVEETVHYITHHDAVREVNKLIRNPEVAAVIREKLGPDEYAQLGPWLNDIAKDGRDVQNRSFIDAVFGRLRFGITLGAMGFKASTGIMQLLGLSNTAAEVGPRHLYQAARMILTSPEKTRDAWQFAVANSKVLEHRGNTMDRELRSAMERVEGKRGWSAAVTETAMKHISLIQTYMVDLPSWYAAYLKEMQASGDEAKAFQYADWVIEQVQGSGATKDMPTLLRGRNETHRAFTMFMTFFSSLWNMERDLGRGARFGRYSPTTVAAKAMFLFAIPVFAEMLLRDELDLGDDGEDDGEDTELQRYMLEFALYPVQSVPFVRDFVNGVASGYDYAGNPIIQVIGDGVRTLPEIAGRSFTDEEITKGQVKGASRFIGAAAGLPGVNQAWNTGEHLYEVLAEGEELSIRQLLLGPDRQE